MTSTQDTGTVTRRRNYVAPGLLGLLGIVGGVVTSLLPKADKADAKKGAGPTDAALLAAAAAAAVPTVSVAVAAGQLGATAEEVTAHLEAGRLTRRPDGRVTLESVTALLAAELAAARAKPADRPRSHHKPKEAVAAAAEAGGKASAG